MRGNKQSGQSMVEFALVVPVFLVLMAGLLDGCRLLFTYNELQEAARVGARWAAVEVNRDNWGTFAASGNQPNTYTANANLSVVVNGVTQPTIVGEVASKLVDVDRSRTTVDISSPIPATCTNASSPDLGTCTGVPITVKVSYQFKPILGFDHLDITLVGKATQYHE